MLGARRARPRRARARPLPLVEQRDADAHRRADLDTVPSRSIADAPTPSSGTNARTRLAPSAVRGGVGARAPGGELEARGDRGRPRGRRARRRGRQHRRARRLAVHAVRSPDSPSSALIRSRRCSTSASARASSMRACSRASRSRACARSVVLPASCMRSRSVRGGVGGVERGAAELDLLLRGEQVAKRDLDARGEPQRGRRRRSRARRRGRRARRRGGAAPSIRPRIGLDRVDLVLVPPPPNRSLTSTCVGPSRARSRARRRRCRARRAPPRARGLFASAIAHRGVGVERLGEQRRRRRPRSIARRAGARRSSSTGRRSSAGDGTHAASERRARRAHVSDGGDGAASAALRAAAAAPGYTTTPGRSVAGAPARRPIGARAARRMLAGSVGGAIAQPRARARARARITSPSCSCRSRGAARACAARTGAPTTSSGFVAVNVTRAPLVDVGRRPPVDGVRSSCRIAPSAADRAWSCIARERARARVRTAATSPVVTNTSAAPLVGVLDGDRRPRDQRPGSVGSPSRPAPVAACRARGPPTARRRAERAR